jgi:hypothetical protein
MNGRHLAQLARRYDRVNFGISSKANNVVGMLQIKRLREERKRAGGSMVEVQVRQLEPTKHQMGSTDLLVPPKIVDDTSPRRVINNAL